MKKYKRIVKEAYDSADVLKMVEEALPESKWEEVRVRAPAYLQLEATSVLFYYSSVSCKAPRAHRMMEEGSVRGKIVLLNET